MTAPSPEQPHIAQNIHFVDRRMFHIGGPESEWASLASFGFRLHQDLWDLAADADKVGELFPLRRAEIAANYIDRKPMVPSRTIMARLGLSHYVTLSDQGDVFSIERAAPLGAIHDNSGSTFEISGTRTSERGQQLAEFTDVSASLSTAIRVESVSARALRRLNRRDDPADQIFTDVSRDLIRMMHFVHHPVGDEDAYAAWVKKYFKPYTPDKSSTPAE